MCVKKARELIQSDPSINFIGNIEGRDIFRGVCDVVVCNGFVCAVAVCAVVVCVVVLLWLW